MFACDCCGCCCRNLNKSEICKHLDRGDGVCRYLEQNLCTIYETRPWFCRVDDCYEAFFEQDMSREEYYRLNEEICKKLKEEECESVCHYH